MIVYTFHHYSSASHDQSTTFWEFFSCFFIFLINFKFLFCRDKFLIASIISKWPWEMFYFDLKSRHFIPQDLIHSLLIHMSHILCVIKIENSIFAWRIWGEWITDFLLSLSSLKTIGKKWNVSSLVLSIKWKNFCINLPIIPEMSTIESHV